MRCAEHSHLNLHAGLSRVAWIHRQLACSVQSKATSVCMQGSLLWPGAGQLACAMQSKATSICMAPACGLGPHDTRMTPGAAPPALTGEGASGNSACGVSPGQHDDHTVLPGFRPPTRVCRCCKALHHSMSGSHTAKAHANQPRGVPPGVPQALRFALPTDIQRSGSGDVVWVTQMQPIFSVQHQPKCIKLRAMIQICETCDDVTSLKQGLAKQMAS